MHEPEQIVVVYRSRAKAACRERGLVLRAMGIAFRVRRAGSEWQLEVPGSRAAVAVRELEAYEEESHDWPRKAPRRLGSHGFAYDGVALYIIVLVLLDIAAKQGWFGLAWLEAGRVNSDLVRQGEWWRSFTALTLHTGVSHIIGNLLLGSVLILVAGRMLGGGLACFSILLAGAAGNIVSAVVQRSGHNAVGASTAVFAALGLIGALNWRHRHEYGVRWATRWAPLVVAALVLSFTGSGGPRTDVIAHLTGFLAGLALGAYYGGVPSILHVRRRYQWLFGLGALGIIAAAWTIALTAFH